MAKSAADQTRTGRRLVGLLGGTFDPIHYGHLRMAEQLADTLKLDEIRFIPSANPPHRQSPQTSAADRCEMVRLAIAGNPRFVLDDRELLRAGASYTIDTLLSLRAELGNNTALCLIMGSDAFIEFDSWHRWDVIPELCHLLLVERPNVQMSEALRPALQSLLRERYTDQPAELAEKTAGRIMIQRITALDISATAIREDFRTQRSPRYLLPDSVVDFIQGHQLYR
ncbi:MAG: nicotinic acid mononucleotide adenylyltransferase [Betaproteobacteria bacterium HGW-Betaproteobacteria-1]|jgi:nicotinate-nucleotide adenylyltransferase|nr:MAG: nicotinic acid mononucleotide adenylyltransferase [Betaproteobacteria bacterium HGW-Betaproteobacteria-1]